MDILCICNVSVRKRENGEEGGNRDGEGIGSEEVKKRGNGEDGRKEGRKEQNK